MKNGTPDHPKTLLLQGELGLQKFAAVGVLETLWRWATNYAPAGNIGRYADSVIGCAIGWNREPAELIDALVKCRWVDRHPEHRLVIHDWRDHAEDTVHIKLARKVERFADGTIPNLTRLNKDERARIEAAYASGDAPATPAPTGDESPDERTTSGEDAHHAPTPHAQHAPAARTAHARRTRAERTTPALAPPSPALPRQAIAQPLPALAPAEPDPWFEAAEAVADAEAAEGAGGVEIQIVGAGGEEGQNRALLAQKLAVIRMKLDGMGWKSQQTAAYRERTLLRDPEHTIAAWAEFERKRAEMGLSCHDPARLFDSIFTGNIKSNGSAGPLRRVRAAR